MMIKVSVLIVCLFVIILGCNLPASDNNSTIYNDFSIPAKVSVSVYDTSTRTIHVFVALCDNKYQGIVPVPAKIGNGKDLNNNLYWGCGYGIRTYFKNSKEWKLLRKQKIDTLILERLVFKNVSNNFYLVADAYNGQYIKQCTEDFLYSCSGQIKDTIQINNTTIGINGNSNLVSYIGHDGLMDFQLGNNFKNTDGKQRDCIILACISRSYFAPYIKEAKANPLVWTTGLMCPEAYTLHDALTGYVNNETSERVRSKAAQAYSKYQKCGEKAARNLLVTGW